MKRYLFAAVVGVVALLLTLAPQVRADGADTFTYTGTVSGGSPITVSWTLPGSPAPNVFVNNWYTGFTNITVTYTYNGSTHTYTNANLYFFSSSAADFAGGGTGGFQLGIPTLVIPFHTINPSYLPGPGVQIFSGSTSAPTFNPGTYNLINTAYGADTTGTLVISTPEPSALIMLLSGFLAATAALGIKKVIA
jgi:hypothetical protein